MKRAFLAATLLALLPMTVLAGTPFRIVAVVNDDIISAYQLDEALRERQADSANAALPAAGLRRQVLDQLIEESLLSQRATEIGLAVADDEVEAAINDVQKQNRIDRKQLEEALARQGIPFDQYRETLRRQILRFKLLGRELQARIEVSSREVRDYYQSHLEDYRQPAALRLSRITFAFSAKGDDAQRDAMRAAATAARSRIERAEDFAKVLADLQQQGFADGGDLGAVAEPEMNQSFVAAVKDLTPGRVSAPVETADGIHLLRLEERIAGVLRPVEEVKGEITDRLTEQKRKTAMQDWLADLKAKARIEIRD